MLEQYNSASDEVQIDMERARGDIYHASADVRRYVLTGEASAKPDLDGIFTEFNAQMDSIRRLSQRAPELQPYFDGMSAAATAWRKDVAEAELPPWPRPAAGKKPSPSSPRARRPNAWTP